MKKNLFIILSLFATTLVGCIPNNQVADVDLQDGEQLFNNQVEDFQYIKDLEDFVSYNILFITENKPYTSDLYLSAKFNENSSLQGGVNFSQRKFVKSKDLENSDVEFNVKAEKSETDTEPFDLSGSVSLLYKDGEMYANLHGLDVFMGEGNIVAKMYTLLGNMVIDNWVDLEIHSGGIVEIDESDNKRLPYIVGSFQNVLKTENIESSPNFLNSVAEIIDTVNSYVDLGISTNELKLLNHEISYSELGNGDIQKYFTGSFQGKQSAFDLSFVASKQGLEIHLYDIKEFNDESSNYEDIDTEFKLLMKENKKSEYSIEFESLKLKQKIVDLKGKIKYGDSVDFSADFVTEPIELIKGQKLSGKLNGNITKKLGESDREIPEITGEILSLTELLSSL